ncbi:putative bifunctional diguanylate cyclase/phosphodiesterase [Teredinibacter purpureus]|uniref:putative bifunctional diguanylate cyclase/phosphodiesterase n=1 Tax=Teredinibacter purpureus TaxID=2731756 RepID=UPI0005F83190|nr:EAL domain-containing protein [Teredinibacter purpureus]
MPALPGNLMLITDLTLILVAAVLTALFIQRRKELNTYKIIRAFALLSNGVVLLACGAVLHLLTANLIPWLPLSREVAANLGSWLPLCIGVGSLLIFLGLEVLINRVIPKSTLRFTQLEKAQRQLASSNDELARTVASRNQELEINNITLRQVLEDQQISRTALLQSEKKFHTLFDKSPTLFLTLDNLHRIADINMYGAHSLGYDVVSLVGQPFSKVVSNEDANKQQDFVDFGLRHPTGKTETEIRLVKNDTHKIWVKVTANMILEEGNNHLLLVCQDITESKKLAESLSYQAKHDDLTGLYNRRTLETFMRNALLTETNPSNLTALIYIDVDQLKIINDTSGHNAGDEFIRALVQQINIHNQQFDFFARIGGDEFALVKLASTEQQAIELAELVRNTAEDFSFQWRDVTFRHTVSIGVALNSRTTHTFGDILAYADAACYLAKQSGRNKVVLHEDAAEKTHSNRNEMLWVTRLQTALMRDRFELYFQPILSLDTTQTGYIHYEVLLRYVDDDGTHISPDAFLPAAERFGLTNQIDLWVLTTTLDFLHRNPTHTQQLSCCSINLSSQSLSSHQSRLAIKQLVMTADFAPTKICFEITETSAIHNLSEVIDFIQELKAFGCRFALDDFGTGFSSFSYLKNLDVDYIKIDGSFIRDITNDKLGQAMVKAMSLISQELGIKTIAEYVENEQVRSELQAMAIHYGQGYGLAKPLPIEKAREYYALTQRIR